MDDLFVSLVKNNRALYDKSDAGYSKKNGLQHNIWVEISSEMKGNGFINFVDMLSALLLLLLLLLLLSLLVLLLLLLSLLLLL